MTEKWEVSYFPLMLALLVLAVPGTADAAVRTANADDPADATPTVSGQPNNPDVSHVTVTYDTNGSLSLSVSFYNSFSTLDTSQYYAFWGRFTLGHEVQGSSIGPYCEAHQQTGDLDGQHHVFDPYGTTFFDEATLIGYSGKLTFTRTTSSDGRNVTISGSSPALANRDYNCGEYELWARVHSTPENLYSDYDAGCDCWYTNAEMDSVGDVGTVSSIGGTGHFRFDDYSPPAPAPAAPPAAPPKPKPKPPRFRSCGNNSGRFQHVKHRFRIRAKGTVSCSLAKSTFKTAYKHWFHLPPWQGSPEGAWLEVLHLGTHMER